MRSSSSFASLVLSLALAFAAESRAASGEEIVLRTVPENVYKLRDPGRIPAESWAFNLVVSDPRNRTGIRPVECTLDYFLGDNLRQSMTLPESTLVRRRTTSYRVTAGMDTLAYQRRFTLDEVFDLPFLDRSVGFRVDRVRITLALEVPDEGRIVRTLDVPLATYSQKTALLFPLRGPAIVSQGRFNDFGHAGHSTRFAIDVLGLGKEYGPMVPGSEGNAEYAGFGQTVVAPGDGAVLFARNDVPDNPPGADPLSVYRGMPDPMNAVGGNSVVIDHGNGEYSVLMHMQQGSVTVHAGDRVRRGDSIGRLGNSGDANGPHLHYQLQDGPVMLVANSLPAVFDNLPGADLSRGSYLTPK